MDVFRMENILLKIAIIIFGICLWLLVRKLNVHREPWDDIPNVETQEDLNKMRIEHGLKAKKINYETGTIAK